MVEVHFRQLKSSLNFATIRALEHTGFGSQQNINEVYSMIKFKFTKCKLTYNGTIHYISLNN